MQAVEQAHQVIAGTREFLGGHGLEPGPLVYSRLRRRLARGGDGVLVVVDAQEGGPPERPGHDDGGCAEPAPDVGHARPRLQLVHHPVQGGQPVTHQVGGVAGAEQPQHAGEQPVVVISPADPGAGAERLENRPWSGRGGDGLEGAGQEDRAVLVGDHHGLLGGQFEGAIDRVIDDVAASRLIAEPLTDVPLRGAGPRGQGRGRDWPGARHRLVEAEPVADVQQQPRDGCAHVGDRLPDEGLQPGLIDPVRFCRGHVLSPVLACGSRADP